MPLSELKVSKLPVADALVADRYADAVAGYMREVELTVRGSTAIPRTCFVCDKVWTSQRAPTELIAIEQPGSSMAALAGLCADCRNDRAGIVAGIRRDFDSSAEESSLLPQLRAAWREAGAGDPALTGVIDMMHNSEYFRIDTSLVSKQVVAELTAALPTFRPSGPALVEGEGLFVQIGWIDMLRRSGRFARDFGNILVDGADLPATAIAWFAAVTDGGFAVIPAHVCLAVNGSKFAALAIPRDPRDTIDPGVAEKLAGLAIRALATIVLGKEERRSCGSCTSCCVSMKVPALGKPAWKPCHHIAPGKGCSIYADRPADCAMWMCGWRQNGPDTRFLKRPDESGVMIEPADERLVLSLIDMLGGPPAFSAVRIAADPNRANAWWQDQAVLDYINLRAARDNVAAIVNIGNSRALLVAAPGLRQSATLALMASIGGDFDPALKLGSTGDWQVFEFTGGKLGKELPLPWARRQ